MAPAERRFLSQFEASLPELPLENQEQVSSATTRVPASFRRFFREFASRLDPTATARRALYSIDGVTVDDRFSTLVRVQLVSSGLKPSQADIDLSEWRSEYELADREAVTRTIISMVERLSVAKRVSQLRDRVVRSNDGVGAANVAVEAVALTVGRPERWVKGAFNTYHQSDALVLPSGFEMLLVPSVFVAAVVNAPIGQQYGLYVPLGLVSFDEKIVARATTLLKINAAQYHLPDGLERQLDISKVSSEEAS